MCSVRPGTSSIKVKKEPNSSPQATSARPRPRRLDLSASAAAGRGPHSGRPSGPLTAKDSAHLAMACLSPGIQTHDPAMREQLQRSMDVREQQRQLIEARQKGGKVGILQESPETQQRTAEGSAFGPPSRAASSSRRKGPPPGLSIHAPSAAAFSSERVIQSAPLHQSFTGLRQQPYPQQPSNLSQTSHIHHVPATQTTNRLPPISDVFANEALPASSSATPRPALFATRPSPGHAHLQSPSFPPPQHQHQHQQQQPPLSARGREFRSAEEAVQEMSRGRDELLPKIVHYGGTQPPTPPSPMPNHHQQAHYSHPATHAHQQYQHAPSHPPPSHLDPQRHEYNQPGTARRRGRDEYERDHGASPLGQSENKRATYALRDGGEADWRASMSGAEKREEFLRLCERAWDLFHS